MRQVGYVPELYEDAQSEKYQILILLCLLSNLIAILGITLRIILIPDIKPQCIKKCNLTAPPQAFTLNCSEFRP